MREVEGSDEQMLDLLKALFDKYDGDADGELDFKEFTKLAKNIKLATKKKDLEKMFADIDTDKGGTIDFGEFTIWYEENTDGEILKRVKGAVSTCTQAICHGNVCPRK